MQRLSLKKNHDENHSVMKNKIRPTQTLYQRHFRVKSQHSCHLQENEQT